MFAPSRRGGVAGGDGSGRAVSRHAWRFAGRRCCWIRSSDSSWRALNAESVYARGFQPTGVAGVFGAAAVGRILGLDTDQIQHALGLAGSMASGSLAYSQNGSDGKRLNAGWTAHAGLTAADLAATGINGPVDVFSGAFGVLSAYSDKADSRALVSGDTMFRQPGLLAVAINRMPVAGTSIL